MLPAAPPTACAATTVSGEETPRFTPVANWNCENMRFETVFEPATKAPRAPAKGAKRGHAEPAAFAAASARMIGIESMPVEL